MPLASRGLPWEHSATRPCIVFYSTMYAPPASVVDDLGFLLVTKAVIDLQSTAVVVFRGLACYMCTGSRSKSCYDAYHVSFYSGNEWFTRSKFDHQHAQLPRGALCAVGQKIANVALGWWKRRTGIATKHRHSNKALYGLIRGSLQQEPTRPHVRSHTGRRQPATRLEYNHSPHNATVSHASNA